MNRTSRALLPLVLAVAGALVTSACGGPPPKPMEPESGIDNSPDPNLSTPPAPPEPPPKGEVQPAPFSSEEIRAATKSGRTYRYRVEVPGKAPRERVLTFTKVDETGCEIFAGGDAPKRMGWSTLQKQAEFPKDRTKLSEETVKLPGGKFDCMVYEVRGKDGEVTTYFFAKTLPGAPVLFYTEVDGTRRKTTTLLQHIQGKGG